MGFLRAFVSAVVLCAVLLPAPGCRPRPARPVRTAETRAVEAKVGDFADYWAEVLRLARLHAAHPDSFRVALDRLPGSHLTPEEWQAWVAPYESAPGELADSLEDAITTVTPTQ